MSKQLNAQIRLRYDSLENWNSKNPILAEGEVALYRVTSDSGSASFMRVGDGVHSFSLLNDFYALAADVYNWAKSENLPLKPYNFIEDVDTYIGDGLRVSKNRSGIAGETGFSYKIGHINRHQNDVNYIGNVRDENDCASFEDVEGYGFSLNVPYFKYDKTGHITQDSSANSSNGTDSFYFIGGDGIVLSRIQQGEDAPYDTLQFSVIEATSDTYGGVKIHSKITASPTINAPSNTIGKYYYVQSTKDGKLFVNIPWSQYGSFSGASSTGAGAGGLVPGPVLGDQIKFLRGDATWAVPTNTYQKGKYTEGLQVSLVENGTSINPIKIPVAQAVPKTGINTHTYGLVAPFYSYTTAATPSSDPEELSSAAPTINARGTMTDRYYPIETDINGRMFVNVPWIAAETQKTLLELGGIGTIKFTATAPLTLTYSGNTGTRADISGSIATAGVDSLGVVKGWHRTSGNASGTRVTNATNSPSINSRTTTENRYYGVETDNNGCMFVNVPWTDTNDNTDTKVDVQHIINGNSGTYYLTYATTTPFGGDKVNQSLKAYNNIYIQGSVTAGEETLVVPKIKTTYILGSSVTINGTVYNAGTDLASILNEQFAAIGADGIHFKGVLNNSSEVPSTYSIGDMYKIGTAGTYAGLVCEVGDMLICIATGTNSDWSVIQGNITEYVQGNNLTTDYFILGNGGKNIKVSSYTLSGLTTKILENLDNTLTAVTGSVISSITQTNGKITSIIETSLPTALPNKTPLLFGSKMYIGGGTDATYMYLDDLTISEGTTIIVNCGTSTTVI